MLSNKSLVLMKPLWFLFWHDRIVCGNRKLLLPVDILSLRSLGKIIIVCVPNTTSTHEKLFFILNTLSLLKHTSADTHNSCILILITSFFKLPQHKSLLSACSWTLHVLKYYSFCFKGSSARTYPLLSVPHSQNHVHSTSNVIIWYLFIYYLFSCFYLY